MASLAQCVIAHGRTRRKSRDGQLPAPTDRGKVALAGACDFLQIYDAWFRPIFAFFIVDLGSRRVVHVGVTREPSSAWAAQQMRHDPDGAYVRRWVPELAHVPGARVHEPWSVDDGYDHGYPEAIVDHAEERAEALRRYEEARR
jgi:hypothetical protein